MSAFFLLLSENSAKSRRCQHFFILFAQKFVNFCCCPQYLLKFSCPRILARIRWRGLRGLPLCPRPSCPRPWKQLFFSETNKTVQSVLFLFSFLVQCFHDVRFRTDHTCCATCIHSLRQPPSGTTFIRVWLDRSQLNMCKCNSIFVEIFFHWKFFFNKSYWCVGLFCFVLCLLHLFEKLLLPSEMRMLWSFLLFYGNSLCNMEISAGCHFRWEWLRSWNGQSPHPVRPNNMTPGLQNLDRFSMLNPIAIRRRRLHHCWNVFPNKFQIYH